MAEMVQSTRLCNISRVYASPQRMYLLRDAQESSESVVSKRYRVRTGPSHKRSYFYEPGRKQ